jgi:hypothetical protein
MPRGKKKITEAGAVPPVRTKASQVLKTTAEAKRAAFVSRAKPGSYDRAAIARLTVGDVYADPYIFKLPAYFDRQKAQGRFWPDFGPFEARFRILTDEHDPFHWTVCNSANEVEWAKDGMEVPDTAYDASGAIIIGDQIQLYRPQWVGAKERELKAKRDKPRSQEVMSKHRDGEEPEPGVFIYYKEGDGAAPSRKEIVEERSDVGELAGDGLESGVTEGA